MKGFRRPRIDDDAPADRGGGSSRRSSDTGGPRSLWSDREVEAFLVRAAESIAKAVTARAPDYVRRVHVEERELVLAEWEADPPEISSASGDSPRRRAADTTGSATAAPPLPGRKTPWH